MGSLLIVCCLASAARAAAAAVVAVAAAGVIDAGPSLWPLSGRVQSQASMLLEDATALRKQMECVVRAKALLGEGVGGDTHLCLLLKLTRIQCINQHQQQGIRSWRQEEEAADKKGWRPRWTGGGGARRGGGSNTTTSQGGQRESAAR
jgi:hypothetical protein